MKLIIRLVLMLIVVVAANAHPEFAMGAGPGGSGGHGGPGGQGGSGWHGGSAWQGGHDWHGGSGWHGNFGVVIGPGWWGPYPYYPYYPYYQYNPYYPYYPSYVQPPVSMEEAPETEVQPPPPVEEPLYWYYCPDPAGYYPDVPRCPKGWLRVVPPLSPPE